MWYPFHLGLAAGCVVLAMTAYLAVSPRWLRVLLLAGGLVALGRYLPSMEFATHLPPEGWPARLLWAVSWSGLTFPAMVAMDQLVRHPAMTPKKLVRWYAPFFAAYAAAACLPEPRWGQWLAVITHGLCAAVVAWFGSQVTRKIPARPLQTVIGVLALSLVVAGATRLWIQARAVYADPAHVLSSEMLTLVAVWFALDTARHSTV